MAKFYNASVQVYVIDAGEDKLEQRFLEKVDGKEGEYTVDFEKFAAYYEGVYNEAHKDDKDGEGNSTYKPFDKAAFIAQKEQDKWEVVSDYIEVNAREAAAEWYRNNSDGTHFGWIGNLWYPDSMLNKEVPDYAKFSSATARSGFTVSEAEYNKVTFDLSTEKDSYNGYFVLIVLSIGLMFLQQFIMMKSQKAANELSSVDGSAAKTNKWMMIIMPIIFGLFSFMYSAAFSIYMIVNTLYGLISTLIINKIVTVRYANREFKTSASGRPSNKAKRLKK